MVHIVSFSALVLAALASLPSAQASPACNEGSGDCLSHYARGWGWPGTVMKPTTTNVVVRKRTCRARSSASASASSSAIASATAIVQNPGNAPPSSFADSSSALATSTSETALETPETTKTTVKASTPTPATTSTKPKPETTTTKAPAPTTTHTTQQAAPTTTQASNSGSSSGSGSSDSSSDSSTSSSDIQQYLTAHNTVRAQHGASALTWSDELASKAQQWANGCKFQHSGGSLGPFGENLAAGTGSSYDIAAAVKSWTDEVSEYDPNNPVPSHFTQVVWKASTQVGCAEAQCSGIFAASFGLAKYFVCEYSPQGNVIGEFAQNVQV